MNATEVSNVTHPDADPFEENYKYISLHDVFFVLKIVMSIANIVTNALTIYVLCKFEKLKSFENSFILHWAVTDALHFVVLLFFHLITHVSDCFIKEAGTTLFILSMGFAFALYLSWTLARVRCRLSKTWKLHYHYILYALAVVKYFILVACCYRQEFFDVHFIYELIVLATVVLNFVKYKYVVKNEDYFKTAYVAVVANIIIFSHSLIMIYNYLHRYTHNDILEYVLSYTVHIPFIVAISCPVIVFYVLFTSNEDFKAALAAVYNKLWQNEASDAQC